MLPSLPLWTNMVTLLSPSLIADSPSPTLPCPAHQLMDRLNLTTVSQTTPTAWNLNHTLKHWYYNSIGIFPLTLNGKNCRRVEEMVGGGEDGERCSVAATDEGMRSCLHLPDVTQILFPVVYTIFIKILRACALAQGSRRKRSTDNGVRSSFAGPGRPRGEHPLSLCS